MKSSMPSTTASSSHHSSLSNQLHSSCITSQIAFFSSFHYHAYTTNNFLITGYRSFQSPPKNSFQLTYLTFASPVHHLCRPPSPLGFFDHPSNLRSSPARFHHDASPRCFSFSGIRHHLNGSFSSITIQNSVASTSLLSSSFIAIIILITQSSSSSPSSCSYVGPSSLHQS